MPSKGLSAKHTRFVAEYLLELNATRAYKTVYGVSQKIAETAGPRLLGSVRVAAAVQVGKARQLQAAELSASRVLEELRRLAFEDRTRLLRCRTVEELEALPAELRALVVDFEVFQANLKGVQDGITERVRRVRMVPKGQALEMLAKHFKLLTEVSELQASDELLERLDRGRQRNAERKGKR